MCEHPFIIIIDGVFFQINQTGIARVWHTLLEKWKQSGFAKHIILIDRAQTAPRIDGIQYYLMPLYDYRERALDSERLQTICNEFQADLFVSTYFTTPLWTPSILMVHDMIPEVFGFDLNELCWQEKKYAILYAARYITVSWNTNSDLLKFYPHINPSVINVIYNGVEKVINLPSCPENTNIKQKIGVSLPYFLLVGSRMSLKGYKNAVLFFKALNQGQQSKKFAVVCVGGDSELEAELSVFVRDINVYLVQLDDRELSAIYSGAIALVYPSLYEGFGLPIAEAMAYGCPVITCRNSSLFEVAGNAAIYVDEYNVTEMIQALEQVQIPRIRQKLIQEGFLQASQFSWDKMANEIENIYKKFIQELKDQQHEITSFSTLWQDFRQEQIKLEERAKQQVNQQKFHLEELTKLQESFQLTQIKLQFAQESIEAMEKSKFWKIRSLWFDLKKRLNFSQSE